MRWYLDREKSHARDDSGTYASYVSLRGTRKYHQDAHPDDDLRTIL